MYDLLLKKCEIGNFSYPMRGEYETLLIYEIGCGRGPKRCNNDEHGPYDETTLCGTAGIEDVSISMDGSFA